MKKYIGDKAFYKMVLTVVLPIIIQNGITNFVGMLDNIMVGRVGTEQMSGVAISNQLMFVFNICIFGAVAGAGIFTAQFFGCNNQKGIRDTIRFKMISGVIICGLGLLIFNLWGEELVQLYLHGENVEGSLEATLGYAMEYLKIMLIGLVPFAVVQVYAGTLRECGETMLPMKAGVFAVLVNLVFNYILIFGKLGIPALGVEGAAIATVISRFAEMFVVVIWTHKHTERFPFVTGVYRSMRIPGNLAMNILKTGMPLLVNEALWSAGMAVMMQCYSIRGIDVVAGMNISTTISNLFNVVFISMGNAVAIIIGQLLGAGKMEEAKDSDRKLIFFSVAICVVIGIVLAAVSPFFPMLYNTTDKVRSLATQFICVSALCMPLYACTNTTYFTLRSGGKTIITFLFDCGFVWLLSIPVAYILSRYTVMPIVLLYLVCQSLELIKSIIGLVLVKKGVWIENIVNTND